MSHRSHFLLRAIVSFALTSVLSVSGFAQVKYERIGSFYPTCISNEGTVVGGYAMTMNGAVPVVVGTGYSISGFGKIQAMSGDGSVLGGVDGSAHPMKVVNGVRTTLDTITTGRCVNVSDDGKAFHFSSNQTVIFDSQGEHMEPYPTYGASADGQEWYGSWGSNAGLFTNANYGNGTSLGGGPGAFAAARSYRGFIYGSIGNSVNGYQLVSFGHGGLGIPFKATQVFSARTGRFVGALGANGGSVIHIPPTVQIMGMSDFFNLVGASLANQDISSPSLTAISEDGLALTGTGISIADGSLVAWRLTVPYGTPDHFNVAPNQATVLDVQANDKPFLIMSTVLGANPAHGAVTQNQDGTFTYTPDQNYLGGDTFTYRLTDGSYVSDPITVVLHVGAPQSLSLSQSIVTGQYTAPIQGTVTLNFTAFSPVVVTLKSTHPERATVPASITVQPGSSSATFNIQSQAVDSSSAGFTSIVAAYNTIGVTQPLKVIPSAPTSVALSPSVVLGSESNTVQGTVNFNFTADQVVNVQLASSRTDRATVPATVALQPGNNSVNFSVQSHLPSLTGGTFITAKINGISVGASLTVLRNEPQSLSLSPTSVPTGGKSTGTLTLVTAAPSGGTDVYLSCDNPGLVTVPGGFTVPQGQSAANFPVRASEFGSFQISATVDGVSVSATLTVTPPQISKLTVLKTAYSGATTDIRVDLTSPEEDQNGPITLSLSGVNATVYASVGSSTVTGTISLPSVDIKSTPQLSVSYRGQVVSQLITVLPAALARSTFDHNPIAGGNYITFIVTLNGVAAASHPATMTSSQPSLIAVPASVNIPAGATNFSMSLLTKSTASLQNVLIRLLYRSGSTSAMAFLKPPTLSGLTVNTSPVFAGRKSSCTITLDGPAPAGGVAVALSSDNAAAVLPSTVTISAGSLSVPVGITTNDVPVTTTATITATLGSATQTASLVIQPAMLTSLNLEQSSVASGYGVVCDLALDGPAPPASAKIAMTSTDPSVVILPATVAIASGVTSTKFLINTNKGTTTKTVTITGTYRGVSLSATLTVTP